MLAAYPAHLILLDVIVIVFGEEYKLRSSPTYYFVLLQSKHSRNISVLEYLQ
jgi:hypothetical protein